MRPLVAALAGEHFQTADLLRLNGADPDVRGRFGRNRLHATTRSGNFEVVRILIDCNPPTSMLGMRAGGRRYFGHQEAIISKTVLSFDYC
jgi:hypothetical protein